MSKKQQSILVILGLIAVTIWCLMVAGGTFVWRQRSSTQVVAQVTVAPPQPPPAVVETAPPLPPTPEPEVSVTATSTPTAPPSPTPTRVVQDTATPTISPTSPPVTPTATSESGASLPKKLVNTHRLTGQTDQIARLVFTPDNSIVASGGFSGAVQLWRIEDETLLHTLEHDSNVFSLAVSPDGNKLAVGLYSGDVVLWEISSGRQLHILNAEFSRIYGVAFNPDGTMLASARQDGNVHLWRVSDGAQIRVLPKQDSFQLRDVAFSGDGQTLAALAVTQNVWLWQVAEGTPVGNIESGGLISQVAFSPDGSLLAVGPTMSAPVTLWQVSDRTLIHNLSPATLVFDLTFSVDGRLLISVGADNVVRRWRVDSGKLVRTIELKKEPVSTAALSPDGSMVAVGTVEGAVAIWQGAAD